MKLIASKYYPLGLFVMSILLAYICTTYRKGDWITGGLLFSTILLPILSGEFILTLAYYFLVKRKLRAVSLILLSLLTFSLLLFTLVYIFKYN
jgi:phosphoglycerol transferase MdoB-like AlkP superfamily enzyme